MIISWRFVDNIDRLKRSEVMSKVRARGNASTELRAMKLLRQNGITGWRRHFPVFGRPDFAFPKVRLALFIDGCFWHGCPRCYRAPKSSQDYWSQKVARNRKRDLLVSKQLRKDGWKVVRIRECKLKLPAQFFKIIKRFG